MILYNPTVTGSIEVNGPIVSTTSTLLSSSIQIASEISGAFTAASSSLASDITTNASAISTIQSDASTLSGRVTDLEAFSSSLDTGYVTESELNTVSSSLASRVAQTESDIAGLDSTYATDADLSTASSSLASRVAQNEADLAGLDSTFATDVQLSTESASLASSITTNAGNISTNATNIGTLTSFSSSAAAALSFDSSNLTVKGNLTVSGTTTTVNSTTIELGDNIIELNGAAAALGGIHVNDTPSKGSLLWDGTNNQWIGGASGSEEKVLLAKSDSIISSSAQVVAANTVGFSAVSASLADKSGAFRTSISGSNLYNVTHNLNEDYPIVQIYNTSKVQVIPDTVTSITADVTQVTFGTSFEGIAVFKK